MDAREKGQEESACFRARRGRRFDLAAVTQMRSAGDPNLSITVCDISTGGFMAECLRPVLIGSYVSLDVPGIGPVHAQVRWQLGGRIGGRFLEPLCLHRCHWTASEAPF